MSTPTSIRLPQRHVEHCMGTVFSIDVRAPGVERQAVDSVVEWLHWVDATFSTYKRSSQISRLARGELAVHDCAPEVAMILQRCGDLTAQTRGYFSAYRDGRLDPSGLVKGWAIQRASELLTERGSRNHCVNGGGDVQCAGNPRPGQLWRVGVADPRQAGHLIGVATGQNFAVATSGSAERGDHILDPKRQCSPTELASVTVVGRHLADVDAYATAAFAMGHDATDWIGSLANCQALIVFADGTQWISDTLNHPTTSRLEIS